MAALVIGVFFACYALGLTFPEASAFLVLLYRAEPLIRRINQARLELASVRGAVREVEWLLDQPLPAPALCENDAVHIRGEHIRFERVSFRYPNGNPGVEDVSFTIRAGERRR